MNDKQIKDLSLANRQQIEAQLDRLGRSTTDRNVIAKILELKGKLASQPPTADKSIFQIDDDITAVLKDAQKDLASGHTIMVGARLDKLGGLIIKRAQACPESSLPGTKREEKQKEKMDKLRLKEKQKREKEIARRRKKGEEIGDLYSPEELLENMLQMAIEEKMVQTQKLQDLHDRLVKNPNDQYAKAMWMPTKIKIEEKDKFINAYGNELQRSALVSSMGSFSAGMKDLIANRKVDDSQFQMMMQDFTKAGVEFSMDQQKVNDATSAFFNNGQSSAMGEAAAAGAPMGQAQAAPSFGAAQSSPMGMGAFSMPQSNAAADPIFSDPAFVALGGGGGANPGNQRLQDAFENVDQYLSGLNNVLKRLDNEIDKTEMKRQDVAAELKELLRRRKSVNADECLAIDAQIDRLSNEHNSLERTIATLKQRSAMCVEKRSMANSIKDLKTASDIDKYLDDVTGGKFADLSELAMDIKGAFEEANQTLEDLGVMNQVASPEINSSTMMGASAAMRLENAEKDEDKYADMEKKFGLR